MFKVPEYGRIRKGPLASHDDYGCNGAFAFYFDPKIELQCIISDGEGWEHVSVVAIVQGGKFMRAPTWDEMCKVKAKFWDNEDCVIQFHPPKSQYVNNHKYCLHLWREIGVEYKTPLTELIGIV